MIGVEWAWRGIAILLAFGITHRFMLLMNQTMSPVIAASLCASCIAVSFALGTTFGYFEGRVVAWVKR